MSDVTLGMIAGTRHSASRAIYLSIVLNARYMRFLPSVSLTLIALIVRTGTIRPADLFILLSETMRSSILLVLALLAYEP